MKNLKQYQGQIWRTKSIESQVSKIINKIDESRDETSSFFSGIISSFLSTLLTMTLVHNSWISNLWLMLLCGSIVFILLWCLLKMIIIPIFNKIRAKREGTNIEGRTNDEVIDYFNSYIVYSVMEMYDSIYTIQNTSNVSCKDMSTVLIAVEWCKCIQFVCQDIRKDSQIRNMTINNDYNEIQNYISLYVFNEVISSLNTIGEVLTSCVDSELATKPNDEALKLLLSDLRSFSCELRRFNNGR